MTKKTKIGIWMDHSVANLMEYTGNPIVTKIIECNFTHQDKEETLKRSESTMHNKEQGELSDYYKEIAEIIKQYDEVLIFGPTEAKNELYNTLKGDHQYSDIKIEIRAADKMTDNQQHAFVREYFEGQKS
ncbi:hypothetical protein ACFX5U_16665 [Sphingobacterium sp. SG20118]|uniref:hypothetical protein n=1 Tax=Sphingobacterium sp. SG20118 TaxID=3367156 RepID=UPI0037DFC965